MNENKICPCCKNLLPEDSEFCQYCGTKVIINQSVPQMETSNESAYNNYNNQNFNNSTLFSESPNKSSDKHKKALQPKVSIPIIIALLLAVLIQAISPYFGGYIDYETFVYGFSDFLLQCLIMSVAPLIISLIKNDLSTKNIRIICLINSVTILAVVLILYISEIIWIPAINWIVPILYYFINELSLRLICNDERRISRQNLTITIGVALIAALVGFIGFNAKANELSEAFWEDYYEERGYKYIYQYNKNLDYGLSNNHSPSFTHYTLVTKIIAPNNSNYYDYLQEVYKIAATGNSSNNYCKDAVTGYINTLPLEYGEKVLLFKLRYTSDNTYNQDIIDYLNEREDISYDDTVRILEHLGFTVDSDGNVMW